MFERFTDRARRVLVHAQEDARVMGHNFIGTEHLLLGLLQESDGVAALVLDQLGVGFEELRAEIARLVPPNGVEARRGKPPFTPRAKKVLELSLREALSLGHNYIGTEHILLGLLREGEGVGAQALETRGLKLSQVREQVLQVIDRGGLAAGSGRRSPALARALADAQRQVRESVMTTSHVLRSVLGVADSQGALALTRLGVTAEALERQMASIPLEQTSDSPPEARNVEIKLGDVTTTIADADLAAALRNASPEQIRAALRQLVAGPAGEPPAEAELDEDDRERAPEPPTGEAIPPTGEAEAG